MPRASSGPQLRPNAKKGGIWYIYWTERRAANGAARSVSRERSTGTRERAEAHQIFAAWLEAGGAAAEGGPVEWTGPRRAAQAGIADVLDLYQQQHAAGHTAAPERTGYAIQALLGFWGGRTCDYIRPETCRAYVRWRIDGTGAFDLALQYHDRDLHRSAAKTGVSTATASRELVVLRAALGYAFDNGKLIENCRSHVEIPGKGPGRDRWLTRSEAARLLWESRRDARVRDHLPLFIMLALRTGARPGALFDLQWPQIDFQHNRIDFNPPGRKRTNKQRPIIPIPRRLRWFLLRAQQRATSPYVLAYRGGKLADVGKGFETACRRAGLGRDVVPYVLRHTCACWLAQAGVDLWLIAGWMGHSVTKTTELYAHHHPSHMDQARKVMD